LEDKIFWKLDKKNEAKKIKRPHPSFGHPLQRERECWNSVLCRFTRKTDGRKAKIPKLLPAVVKQWVFLHFPSLFLATLTVGSAHRARSVPVK